MSYLEKETGYEKVLCGNYLIHLIHDLLIFNIVLVLKVGGIGHGNNRNY